MRPDRGPAATHKCSVTPFPGMGAEVCRGAGPAAHWGYSVGAARVPLQGQAGHCLDPVWVLIPHPAW